MLRSPPSGASTRSAGSHGTTDAAAICQALRQGEQKRLSGRRSCCRGGSATDHAVRSAEERGSAGPSDDPSHPAAAGGATYGIDQPAAGDTPGAWDHGTPTAPHPGAAPSGHPRRRAVPVVGADPLRAEWRELDARIDAFDAELT